LTYTYGPNGNRTVLGGTWARTGLPSALTSATYNAANHQLTWGGQSQTFDLNGNLTSDGTNTYTWDARNRLVSISGGSAASFQYDPLGRRTSKIVNSAQTGFLYDGLNPVQELNGSTVTANLLTGLGLDEYLTRTDTSGASHFLSDALGSTVALTDPGGALPTSYTYAPFGATSPSGSATGNAFDYTGREDDGTGLKYYRARYYHPGLQRFIGEDPIGLLAGDTNFYAYAGNNPVNFVDPDGLSAVGDFFRGSASYFKGVYGTFRYSSRLSGLLGECEQRRAELEGIVFVEILRHLPALAQDPDVQALAIKAGREYASTHKARILGRVATGAGVTYVLVRAGGGYGQALSASLNLAALHGNVRSAIESGGHELEDAIRAIIGGETSPLGGRKDRCQ